MLNRLSEWIAKSPKKLLLISVLVITATLPGILRVKGEFDPKIWFMKDDPYLLAFQDFERKFGNDDAAFFIFHHKDGVFTKERLEIIQQVTDEFWKISDVVRVDSLSNYNWVHTERIDDEDEIIIEPLLPDELTDQIVDHRKKVAKGINSIQKYLISEDETTSVLYAKLKPLFGEKPNYQKIHDQTVQLQKKYQSLTDMKLHLGGIPSLTTSFKDVSISDLSKILPLLLLAIIIIFYFIFGFNRTVIYPFLIIVLSNLCTFGFAGYLNVGFNVMTSMIPSVLIAISLADTIHILTSYHYQKNQNFSSLDAILYSLSHNLKPTLMTSLTTSIGFFSLLTTELVPIREFGLLAGIGTITTWFLTIFLMVPFLILFPSKAKVHKAKKRQFINTQNIVAYLNKYKTLILVTFFSLTIILAYIASFNEINSTTLDYLDDEEPIKISHQLLVDKVGGDKSIQLVINSGSKDGIKDPKFLGLVDQFEKEVSQIPSIGKVSSLLTVIKEVNQALNNSDPAFYAIPKSREKVSQELLLYSMGLPPGMNLNYWNTLDNRILRMNLMWNVKGSKKVYSTIQLIEQKAAELGLDAKIAGKMQLIAGLDRYIVETFFSSMRLALIIVTILMMIFLRSFKLGLLSMIPNIAPPLLGLGIMTLLGKTIDIGTILIFSVCLGIAVDDTIYFLTDFSDRADPSRKTTDILVDVLNHSGRALTFTTLLLVAGFGCFVFGNFIPNKNFGMMTAIILFIALITDIILLPCALLILPRITKK